MSKKVNFLPKMVKFAQCKNMEEDFDPEEDKGRDKYSIGLGVGIAIGIIIGAIIFGQQSKFDGMTAREWYDEYDWLVACVDESTTPKLDCI